MPNNFLPAVYDARNNKFYGDRPDGTLAYVDPNPKTRNVSSTSSQYPAYAMVTTADVGNIIEVDSPAGKHSLVYLPDSNTLNLTGTLNVSGTINANFMNIEVTNKNVINMNKSNINGINTNTHDTHVNPALQTKFNIHVQNKM